MSSIMNWLALYGGLITYVGTFLIFTYSFRCSSTRGCFCAVLFILVLFDRVVDAPARSGGAARRLSGGNHDRGLKER